MRTIYPSEILGDWEVLFVNFNHERGFQNTSVGKST